MEKLSPSHAAQLFHTAALIDAKTLAEWGLINEVVPGEHLVERALEVARQIAERSPEAARHVKVLTWPLCALGQPAGPDPSGARTLRAACGRPGLGQGPRCVPNEAAGRVLTSAAPKEASSNAVGDVTVQTQRRSPIAPLAKTTWTRPWPTCRSSNHIFTEKNTAVSPSTIDRRTGEFRLDSAPRAVRRLMGRAR